MGNYKKYIKEGVEKDYGPIKLFIISFFGMLFVFTFLIVSFSPKVDVSIGDYKQEDAIEATNVDGRLAMLQEEDNSKNFKDIVSKAEDIQPENQPVEVKLELNKQPSTVSVAEAVKSTAEYPVYKVYVGSYTSQEQAKVAKDIIQESGLGVNPIVKCLGSNNYTLQVGIFKNRSGAEALLSTVQQSHLPARIVQEY